MQKIILDTDSRIKSREASFTITVAMLFHHAVAHMHSAHWIWVGHPQYEVHK